MLNLPKTSIKSCCFDSIKMKNKIRFICVRWASMYKARADIESGRNPELCEKYLDLYLLYKALASFKAHSKVLIAEEDLTALFGYSLGLLMDPNPLGYTTEAMVTQTRKDAKAMLVWLISAFKDEIRG